MVVLPPNGLLPAAGLDDRINVGAQSLLAWDVLEGYGAVFSTWLSPNGEIHFEAEIMYEESAGQWSFRGSGGNTRTGWDVPFPPSTSWPFSGLAVMGTQGFDIEAQDGLGAALDAVFGFLAPPATAVAVSRGATSRIIECAAGSRAFIALAIGVAKVELTPLGESGSPVGVTELAGHQPW